MTFAAARLVALRRADEYYGIIEVRGRTGNEPLRPGRLSSTTTYGSELVNQFGVGQQLRHRAKGHTAKIEVQTGDDYPLAATRQLQAQVHYRHVEELALVERNHLGGPVDGCADLFHPFDRFSVNRLSRMRRHRAACVPVIKRRLEDLHLLFRDEGPLHPPDQLLRLAAEHGAHNCFKPSAGQLEERHSPMLTRSFRRYV